MTQKLVNAILATCLLFGSLYLPTFAAEANKAEPATVKSPIKKSAETYFLEGSSCLQQEKIACATLALANISSLSPYAKLLKGSIAWGENRVDDSLLLLLPLQSEKHLIIEAKISLHQHLAKAFASLGDTQQALWHLMQAEAAVISAEQEAKVSHTKKIHQEIWALLSNQSQNQLITMRGDNTDNEFQGWIDLSLAAKNQDVATSIANWLTYYPDHSARALAKNLALQSNASASKISAITQGGIALILPMSDEANITQAEAFQQGLQAALTKHGLNNEIKTYIGTNSLKAIIEQHAQAKSEGSTYFIAPQLTDDDTLADMASYLDSHHILSIGLPLKDEAMRMTKFATSHAMQHLLIINTDSEVAQAMTSSFRTAWQAELGASDQNDKISAITLPNGVTAEELGLFDLKAQVAAIGHDMVVLAMSASDVRTIRPHLNISTPTLTFSAVNDAPPSDTSFNALRFVDIPFLLPANNDAFTAYHHASANLNLNALLRWFALGVDTLQLLAASTHTNRSELIINGLTGELTLDQSGLVRRKLSIARFIFNGVELEQ
ncbi:MAG: hypothetical protein Q8N02_12145 [Methylotenera sp.]|nr:hypothetical protein [Methylotenera sp.]MDO9233213.1 hypothetical protein [Methylotenera sp.]MDO9388168.1 hypothetical protein [Methylotenera sp.]MDP2103043.1 hypothetical protein [Methylotenera sp.]MDP2281524.1 hypothetical protein [Methylotenera sp.]